MKPLALLLLLPAIFLPACGLASPPTPTASLIPSPAPATVTFLPPTATKKSETATPSKLIVTEGSDWAKAGVPVGLEIISKENVYYAINAVGQEVELGKLNDANQFELADALKWKLAATREESNTSISKIPWELASKGAANRVGKLIGTPFGKEVVTDKDVTSKGVVKSNELRWTAEAEAYFNQHPEAVPAKIIGYFTTEYEGKTLWGKVVEWDTKDEGIVYISLINTDLDYNQSHPGGQIFPIGLLAKDVKAVEPMGLIMKDDDINALLRIWIDNNNPPIALEDFILIGRTG
jgi:hypothetical protein